MGQHGDQVIAGRCRHPLIPQAGEVFQALQQDLLAVLVAVDKAHSGNGRGDIRPVGQFGALLEGEIEQRSQHARGQLDGDLLHPVEGLSHRQVIQYIGGALANNGLEIAQVFRAGHRRHHLALLIVPGAVHGDEHGQGEVLEGVPNGDGGLGGVNLVGSVHLHDVLVAGNRPVGGEKAGLAQVHRRLVAQALEPGPLGAAGEQEGVGHIQLFKRQGVGVLPGLLGIENVEYLGHG